MPIISSDQFIFALFAISMLANLGLCIWGSLWRQDARFNEGMVSQWISRYNKIVSDKNAQIQTILEEKKKETLTVDARQLLHDLTAGEAHVRILPIDPQHIFWRSPR